MSSAPTDTHKTFLADLARLVGPSHLLTDPAKTQSYRKGFRSGQGEALAVVFPGTLLELWRVLNACVDADKIILMQAANTGLTEGSTPNGNDYDREIVIISTLRLDKLHLLDKGEQVLAWPGTTLYSLEKALKPLGREPHSVIGSSCIGASVIGGICNNSGGSLVQRGPAYTEMSLFAQIDADGKLIGRLTIDEIVDVVYEETDNDLRRMGGLSDEEDVFAPVSKAVKTRWAWLAVNLCTAFIASRVIDGFEHTISQLVALASLMPIVAGIGGNTGNQTITMIVRAMALQQIQPGSFTFLILREMGVALINGLVWGGIMGAITWWLYDDPQLGGVMTLAMMLNLLMAAMMGVIIPMVMVKLGRDPAVGSSVMITAITDTGGFFIFLGLATLFLM